MERLLRLRIRLCFNLAIFFIYLLIIYPACPARDEKSDDPPARVVAFSFICKKAERSDPTQKGRSVLCLKEERKKKPEAPPHNSRPLGSSTAPAAAARHLRRLPYQRLELYGAASTGCCFSLGSGIVLGGHLRRVAGGCARGLFRRCAALAIRGLPAGCAAVHGGRVLSVCAIRRGHAVLSAAHTAEACTGCTGLGGSGSKGGAASSERIVTVGGNIRCAVEHIVCIAQGGAAVYGVAAGIGNGKVAVPRQAHGAVCAHAAAIGHIALRSVDGVAHTRAAACILLVFVLVVLLSRRAIDPVVRSAEKQKQFITDASHELKTPITVISTCLRVLEMETGKQKWIDKAQAQTEKLTALVNALVTLSRMDEGVSPLKMEPFPLSEAVADTAEPFRDLAQSKGHDLVLDIAPELTYKGDEYAIRQLVSILLDNAVKYARAGSAITLTLEKTRRGAVLRCRNGSDPIPEDTLAKLFDRFYRADPSRSAATGGFGIGLSIARGIAEAHKGSICARMVGEEVEFAAELR